MYLASDIPLHMCAPLLLRVCFFCLEPEAQSIISKEKDTVCDGDTGLYNVELWSIEVSCLEFLFALQVYGAEIFVESLITASIVF